MNEFYIFGGGPSVNEVTEEQWEKVKISNSIGFAFFSLKNRKTKYYYLGEYTNDDLIALNQMKKNNYEDTYIFSYNMEVLKRARELGFNNLRQTIKGRAVCTFNNEPWLSKDNKPPYPILDNMALSFRQPLMRFRGQLCSVINIALILKADKIKLTGIDLNNQYHFFDIYKDYNDIMIKNMEAENSKRDQYINWDRNKIHSTACELKHETGSIATVPMFLKELKNELQDIGKDVVVCSKNSKLYKEGILEYEEI